MNLRHLSDDALQLSIEGAVQGERNALSIVLHHLREVDRRRLYSKFKFQSLKDYAVKKLKYTESGAWLRIAAMQLVKELPELESKINDGSLQLSNLVMVKRAFNQEAKNQAEGVTVQANLLELSNAESSSVEVDSTKSAPVMRRSKEEKLAVIAKLENVTKREAVKVIERETGVKVTATENTRVLSDGRVEIKTIVDQEAIQIIEQIKGLLAHSNPKLSTGELLTMALKALRQEIDPIKKSKATKRSQLQSQVESKSEVDAGGRNFSEKTEMKEKENRFLVPEQAHSVAKSKSSDTKSQSASRYIQADIKRYVWQRDQGRCTNCRSIYAVQIEHITPFAKGGRATRENLKLLCRSCNQRSAIEVYGVNRISSFLKAPVSEYH